MQSFEEEPQFVQHDSEELVNDYALGCCAEMGHLEMVKYLVEQGADIHAKDDSALRWSAEKGHLDVVDYLMEQGADINAYDDFLLRWMLKQVTRK
jgi:ankyrin repeat protein